MSKYLLAASAFALFAGPASALTAPELWADWQETLAGFGSTLSAESEDYSNGVLVLKNMTQTGEMFETTTETVYGDVTLTEQDDGSVRIEVPDEFQQSSTVTAGGESIETSVRVVLEGLDAVVRDDGADRIYDISASAARYAFEDLSAGEADEPVAVEMVLSDYDTITRVNDEAYEGEGTFGLSMSINAPGEEPFEMSYAAEGMSARLSGTIPNFPEGDEVPSLAELNLSYDMEMTHSGSSLSVDALTPDGPLAIESTSGGGGLVASMSSESTSYGFSATDVAMTVTPPAFPLPIAASASEMGFDMEMPLAEGQVGPFGLGLTFQDLAVDEALWGLFDPTGQLPRDPATIELDASGEAQVIANLMDPATMESLDGPPFLPTALNLNTLLVNLAGAELRGEGAVEWPSILANPVPTGAVTVELDGGFGLLDALVALGFVPPQQVAIVRGMAGAIAEPVGDDQLRSEIEFTEGGILANGLPLPF